MTDNLIIYKEELEYFLKACKSVNVTIHNVEQYTDDKLLIVRLSFNYAYQMFFVGGQIELLKQLRKFNHETL